MDDFESLLAACRSAVERFVYFRLTPKSDADDVLQEIYLTAYRNFHTLKDKSAFKVWLLALARNKCADYFREQAKLQAIPLESLSEETVSYCSHGAMEQTTVAETLEQLCHKDREILHLYYFHDMKQAEIARRLGIPLGTVKSRLHTAKKHFKEKYPYLLERKGDSIMKLPKYMPEYQITKSPKEPYAVKWEEMMGWFIVPKLGEKLCWGMYDYPERTIRSSFHMSVTGNAYVHGIKGVQIEVKQQLYKSKPDRNLDDMRFVAQLTDTHCRILAESHYSKDREARMYFTFLDGDKEFEDIGSFQGNWGFGENNCGNEIHIQRKGDITRNGDEIVSVDKPFLLDIVGRYTVTIGGKEFDTVCVMDIETYNPGVVSEQFLDKNGRTILWRRFNRDDWAFDRYKQKWSEMLPQNERLTVNGKTYVHWHDCITDYIL